MAEAEAELPEELPEELPADAGDGSPAAGADVPEQIDPILTPRHVEPQPEPEQIPVKAAPQHCAPPATSARAALTGSVMGLGEDVVFYNHELPAKETGGIEVLEQRRRQMEESTKDRETFALLEDVLAEHWLTSDLTQDVRAALVDSMVRRIVAPGQKVVSRGEEGDCLLILGSGQCEVTSADAESDDSDEEQQAAGVKTSAGGVLSRLLEPGDCMGGVMLVMPGHVHVATVKATAPSEIWTLRRTRFQDLVHSRTAAALQIRMDLLQACPWLSSLDEEQLGRLAAVGRLHCCPVGARSVFDRDPAQTKPRCRYVLEEPDEGPDDFDWTGASPSLPQEPVYDYRNSKGVLPTTGSVRPLRPQALTPTAKSPSTVLVERIFEGHDGDKGGRNTNGRELHLLAISGAAFSWLLGEAVCAELQAAISLEYPITPEEAEAELMREIEREEEALAERIQAAKMQTKGPPRPSAAAMSMASALASYGATPAAVKSSSSRGRGRAGPRNGQISNKKSAASRHLTTSDPALRSVPASFQQPGQLAVTSAVGMATEARKRMIAHQLAEQEKARRVEQVDIRSLEFFTPSHLMQTDFRPYLRPPGESDENVTSTAEQDLEQKGEDDGCLHFKDGRLAYQHPSHQGQVGRYLFVRPTAKQALSVLGAERRWLHSLRLWAELPANPGLLALAGAGESKRHLYTMTVWKGGESLADAATRSYGNGADSRKCSGKMKAQNNGALRLKRKAVAFYAVQIIDVLDALHKQRVVYRSLTPASLQLDGEGQIQLGSFGLAKRLGVGAQARTYTLCAGALGYLAPEQLQHTGHGTAVDHWALGVLLCELLTGLHPFSSALCSFRDGDGVDSYDGLVHNGRRNSQPTATVAGSAVQEIEDKVDVLFSGGDIEVGLQRVLRGDWAASAVASRLAAADADAADLIDSLLQPDPADRPCTAGRTGALVQHPWFVSRLGDNLVAVRERTARPPLEVRGPTKPPKPGSGVYGSFWKRQ